MIPSLAIGGMERVMTELANYLIKITGVEVHLILYGRKRDIFFNLSEKVKVHRPRFEFRTGYRTWDTLRTVIFLRKRVNELNPDCILSFGEYWNNLVLLSLYGCAFPIIVADRSSPIKSLKYWQEKLRRLLYSNATAVLVQTSLAEKIYRNRIDKANIITIGNPIRVISFDVHRPREKIVLSVGRLIGSKHHDLLIKIFSRIALPDWKLIIVGDDAQNESNRAALEELIRDLRSEKRIFLAGTRLDVDDFYCRSSIFAFTSSSEGFPNVIGEALSAGLPIVAFDCIAGPSELITNGQNGFLVPVFDTDQFGDRLQLLMENDSLRRGMQNHARSSIEPYRADKIFGMYQRMLESYSRKS
jgi:GalNAc-alpha-(1->4)-GalNAc-alpha-(1->3)-diNAcBac-PP-undecaprenol alpha-1,4-N-acetyl-D-galactosaminyltransferase